MKRLTKYKVMRDHKLYYRHDTHKDVNYDELEESHLFPVQASTVFDLSTTIADTARCRALFSFKAARNAFSNTNAAEQ